MASVLHGLDEALGPQVGPVALDVVQAGLAGVDGEHRRPARGDLGERGPQRVLALVVDQDVVLAAGVFERVRHRLLSSLRVTASLMAAATLSSTSGRILPSWPQPPSCTSIGPAT